MRNFNCGHTTLTRIPLQLFGNTPINVNYLTDINQSDILLSIRITAKKEVAELTLR